MAASSAVGMVEAFECGVQGVSAVMDGALVKGEGDVLAD